MTPRKDYYRIRGEKLKAALEKRGFAAAYVPDAVAAGDLILENMEDNASVTWGGTMTLQESGILDRVKAGGHEVYDRDEAVSPEEVAEIYHRAFSCDYYLMSANGVSLDGKLVNIDGRGNRVAALIYGPKRVIVVAGMNKVAVDEAAALERARNEAAPINALRLEKRTPCTAAGICSDCLSPDCICSHTVITRRCAPPGRILVILVGEALGY